MKVFVYGKQLHDLESAIVMCERAFPHEDFIILCEKTADRRAFEALLGLVKKGDVVFISALQALKDGYYCTTIMEKVRRLCKKGAVLKIGLQPDFTYKQYEAWYKVQKELDEWETVYRVHFEVEDTELDGLDMSEEVPELPYNRCMVDDDYYMWE